MFHFSLLFFKQTTRSSFLCKSSSAFPLSFPLLCPGPDPWLVWNEMLQTGHSRLRWDPISLVLGAVGTTVSVSAKCMKNKQSPRGQTVLALLFASKFQTTIMVPEVFWSSWKTDGSLRGWGPTQLLWYFYPFLICCRALVPAWFCSGWRK